MTPAIRLEDVVFRYYEKGKRNILDHTSLEIRQGTITVLMGSSGCGKSTLAAVLAGLYPENGGYLEQGTIELFGNDLRKMSPRERAGYFTMMFQSPDLQFCMDTLRKEMRFCMENLCVPREQMDEKAERAARELGLTALLDQPLHTLSGGEKQKAALACLYVMGSPCILLDEAFANIDPSSAQELIRLLEQMRQAGRTIVAIDHQCGIWAETADEFVILGSGCRVLQRGIKGKDLAEYRGLFEQEGLFYPEALTRISQRRSGQPAVTFRGVSIPRGEKSGELLLEAVDAEFPAGCVTAVLGPSGSGKTTTFLSMLKQHPYGGKILIDGMDLERIPLKKLFRQAGIVFQNPSNQFITQNVTREVTESLRFWGEKEPTEKAERLLEEYGLYPYRKYSPYMLSQGQQRRLAVLSVLTGGQKILLLDEPTYGQDLRSVMAIMHQLRQKVEAENLTVILITHDTALAKAYADKIYQLENRTLTEVMQ